MDIYTIGHSNYDMDKFIHMLKHYNIDTVVDIRGIPYSKYNVDYDKEKLALTMKDNKFNYIYMGRELAANRSPKISYNKEGYCDFEKAVQEESFISGVNRLRNGVSKGYTIALLGAMQDPIRCHRSIMVGRELIKYDFNVMHILDDLSIEKQSSIENRLLDKYFAQRNQLTLDHLLGNAKSDKELISEAYKKANREIGIRVENLRL